RLGGVDLGRHVARGAVEQLALLGQDETARVAMEQHHTELLLERADLARDRRLTELQRIARMREAAGIRHGLKDPQLGPIHDVPSKGAAVSSAACARRASWRANHFSASRAAMQPVPAAVTAWRKILSCTSPAAHTPSTSVAVESGLVMR